MKILMQMKKSIKTKHINAIAVLSVVFAVILLLGIGIIFFKVYGLKKGVTGFATTAGYVNITIKSVTDISALNNTINWSSGYITSTTSGTKYANLSTNDNGNATVINGNWTPNNAYAITIMNSGNVNCSLSIQSAKDAADFFVSASSSNQTYSFNITEKDISSCGLGAAGAGKNATSFYMWHDFDKSSQNICSEFDFHTSTNRLYLNVRLQVPYDASIFGNNNDTITITCT
jgi:hypothetical protein